MSKIVITVDIDNGDCPEVRARLANRPGKVGANIPAAVRLAVAEALYTAWPAERYGGPATYRKPQVGSISVAYEGPADTFKEQPR
jgi:hypothetical protein